jgi:hypothetical protein
MEDFPSLGVTAAVQEFQRPVQSIFFRENLFPLTGSDTDVLIQAEPSGPTDSQRTFYQNFQTNFDAYAAKMKPLIEDEFRNWQPEFEIKDFRREFTRGCTAFSYLSG